MKIWLGFTAAFLLLSSQVATAYGATFQLGKLTESDVGESLGDCGLYLHHQNGALIFFYDLDTAFIKIDGKVYKLSQTQLPKTGTSGSPAVYSNADGRIKVQDKTRVTKALSHETDEVAGSLTITFAAVSRTLQVKGSSGC